MMTLLFYESQDEDSMFLTIFLLTRPYNNSMLVDSYTPINEKKALLNSISLQTKHET